MEVQIERFRGMDKIIIGQLNIRSLFPKLEDLKNIFLSQPADYSIFCITETWISPDITDSMLKIENYKLYRADRRVGRGGGVCMYIKESVATKQISPINTEIEQLWIEVKFKKQIYAIGTVYRPPSYSVVDFLNCLELNIIDMLPKYDEIICLGDFNIDMLRTESSATIKLNKTLESLGLVQLFPEYSGFPKLLAPGLSDTLIMPSLLVPGGLVPPAVILPPPDRILLVPSLLGKYVLMEVAERGAVNAKGAAGCSPAGEARPFPRRTSPSGSRSVYLLARSALLIARILFGCQGGATSATDGLAGLIVIHGAPGDTYHNLGHHRCGWGARARHSICYSVVPFNPRNKVRYHVSMNTEFPEYSGFPKLLAPGLSDTLIMPSLLVPGGLVPPAVILPPPDRILLVPSLLGKYVLMEVAERGAVNAKGAAGCCAGSRWRDLCPRRTSPSGSRSVYLLARSALLIARILFGCQGGATSATDGLAGLIVIHGAPGDTYHNLGHHRFYRATQVHILEHSLDVV
nr:unnamed protein product [Callosobruchus chinensis]